MRDGWRLAAWMILLAAAFLSLAHWPVYPYFLDHYYHLSVVQGFHQAGGPVLHAFWEAAPEGRPHLYPPLLHLASLPAVELGLPLLALSKVWCAAIFPLLLAAAWFASSRMTTTRQGCLFLLALSIPYSFYLGCLNYVPATLVLVMAFGVQLALFRRRPLAAGLFLAGSFWLHAGLSWLLALGVLLFGFMDSSRRKAAWAAVLIGLAMASPWLAHLARHISLFQLQPRGEDRYLETPILLVLLSLAGWVVAFRRGGIHRFPAALAIGFLPIVAAYRFRFFATQGLFPWLLLAGVALDALIARPATKPAGRLRRPWAAPGPRAVVRLPSRFCPEMSREAGLPSAAAALLLVCLTAGSPTLLLGTPGPRIRWADTTLNHLAGWVESDSRPTENSLFYPKFMDPLAQEVRAHTEEDELIFANVPYFAGMLSISAGRAITNQMLREMADRSLGDQVRSARLIVWLKESPHAPPSRRLQELAAQYRLRPLAQTDLAHLYFNPWATARRQMPKPAMPWKVAEGIILLAAGWAAWDLGVGRRSHSRS